MALEYSICLTREPGATGNPAAQLFAGMNSTIETFRFTTRKLISVPLIADCERTIDHEFRSEDRIPAVTSLLMNCPVWPAALPEARGDLACELFFPTALHLRHDRHGLERLNTRYDLNKKSLVCGATHELL